MPSSVLKATFAEQSLCDRHTSSRAVPTNPWEVGISPIPQRKKLWPGLPQATQLVPESWVRTTLPIAGPRLAPACPWLT